MKNIDQIKSQLDKELKNADPNVGIAFGCELFNEFKKRGWFTVELFGALGTTLFAEKVPAYDKTHFVFATWDIPDSEYRVGKSQ